MPDLAIDGPDAATNTDTTDNTGEIAEPATTLGRLFWHWAMAGDIGKARDYVFDTRPLTNARPYFAAYEKVTDLPRTLDRLDLFQDDWGYLLLWATLGIAATAAAVLIVLPMVIGWRTPQPRAVAATPPPS